MTNSIIFKIFLLLYLATRGLVMGENGQELSLYLQECGIMPDTAKTPNSCTLEISSNTSELCKCHSIYLQLDNTDTSYDGVNDNCTISCTDVMPSKSNQKTLMIALIASVTILTVLLGIVILCWIGTYRTMKKKILRALQTTVATAMPATANSLTSDTNNEDPPNQQPLCFQNASYEQNSPGPSFSQSPAPECPETNIYDLPFQISAGVNKEIPKPPETLPKSTGSMRYKGQDTLPKGSLRYTAHKPRSLEPPGESKNVGQSACAAPPESPRVKEIEFSCSINEQQWIAVNEYEVPITQQETQN